MDVDIKGIFFLVNSYFHIFIEQAFLESIIILPFYFLQNNFIILPPDFPRVTTAPSGLRVEEGDTAVLECSVDSKPRVETVKWTRAGRYIATTFHHVIPTVTLQHAGAYYCEADNGLGQTGKAELQLEVQHGPRVVLPASQETPEGAEVRVECKVEATPEPDSVVWSRSGQPTFRQRGRFLTLRNVTASEAGPYTCSASNTVRPSGQDPRQRVGNATVRLEVRHAPGPAYIEPVDPVGVEGKAVELQCGASPSGFPAPQYQWWAAGKPEQILGRSASLILRPVRVSSAGSYYCQPYNTLGRGSPVAVVLRVVQEPTIVTGLPNQVVSQAGRRGLNLTCLGMGRPTPTATWYRNGQPLGAGLGQRYRVEGRDLAGHQGQGLRLLTILVFQGPARVGEGLEHHDSGEYTCQFDNSVGRAQSAVVLKVEHPPFLSETSSGKVAADPGEKALLSCRVTAFPAPTFQWERRGLPLRADRSIKQLSDFEYESVFTVWSVTRDSYGSYVCRATNSLGSQQTTVELVRRGKPEVPGQPSNMEAGANSLLLTWQEGFNGGVNDTVYALQWEEQGAGPGSGGERECREAVCELQGLRQHTTYRVRVRAANRLGRSEWTEALPFTTQIDVSQIPGPESIFFEKMTKTISFKVSNYPLHLAARLEVQASDGSWQYLRSLSLKNRPYKFTLSPMSEPTSLRVRLCLESNDLLCGAYSEASVVDRIQEPHLFSETGHTWLLAVIVTVLISCLVTLIILIKCCCRGGRKAGGGKQETIKNRPDILQPSLSFDNKILSSVGERQYLEQGSLTSQEELWRAKEEAAARGQADYAHYPRPEEYLGEGGLWGRGEQEQGHMWGQEEQDGSTSYAPEQYNVGPGDQYAVSNRGWGKVGEAGSLSSLRPPRLPLSLGLEEEESTLGTPRRVIREIIV